MVCQLNHSKFLNGLNALGENFLPKLQNDFHPTIPHRKVASYFEAANVF